jgi:hypothetical protein
MRSKSAPESAESEQKEKMRSISAPESAESGRKEKMKSKSAPESAESARQEEMRSIVEWPLYLHKLHSPHNRISSSLIQPLG